MVKNQPDADGVFRTYQDPFQARELARRLHRMEQTAIIEGTEEAQQETQKAPKKTPKKRAQKDPQKYRPSIGQVSATPLGRDISATAQKVSANGAPPLKGGGAPVADNFPPFSPRAEMWPTVGRDLKTAAKTPSKKAPLFTLVEDTREQTPLTEWPSWVAVERGTLATGDYSIRGYEQTFAIERKSLADFAGTMMGGYESNTQKAPLRFNNELARLRHFDIAAIIVTATPQEAIDFKFNCGQYAHTALWQFACSIYATHGIPVFFIGTPRLAAQFVADLARHYVLARTKKNRGNATRATKAPQQAQEDQKWSF